MGSISLLQWRKAYMLEFIANNKVEEVFTFSVPPESEELNFSQRITETKTFGGSVFDDYGNDSYRITLAGSTINEERKLIYRGLKKPPKYLTGTKEIFELQKIIKNWADGKVSGGFLGTGKTPKSVDGDRKVYLYDLSKMSVLQLATGTASRNYWRVFIKDLKIKRDKSKPKTYNYTLEMIGVEDEAPKVGGLFSGLAGAVDAIQNVMDGISAVMELTEATTAAVAEIARHCEDVKRAFEQVQNRDITAGLVALNVGSSIDLVSRIMGGESNTFYNSTKNMLEAIESFKGLSKSEEEETAKTSKTQNTSKFWVYFNSEGGSSVKSIQVDYCKTVTKPNDPTKDKYSFGGWFTDEECKTAYDFNSEVTKSFTLYAKWVLSVATVTFNSRNGSSVPAKRVNVGSTVEKPDNPTRKGYVFDVWCTDYDTTHEFNFNTPVTQDMTLYAKWREVCNVTFDSNGGSSVAAQSVSIGELAVYPITPTKENYTFAYWCIDSELQQVYNFATPVTQDMTLYACYVQISNTVTFDSNGGSAVQSEKVVIGGRAIKPSNPTKEGYDFVYWCTDSALTNEFRFATTPVNSNITLYAKWTESVYEVSFDTDGGSEVLPQQVKHNGRVIFPDIPVKENANFMMWRTRKEVETEAGETEYEYEEYDFNTPVTADLVLYAEWFGGD